MAGVCERKNFHILARSSIGKFGKGWKVSGVLVLSRAILFERWDPGRSEGLWNLVKYSEEGDNLASSR
jgi:hypothetical protein